VLINRQELPPAGAGERSIRPVAAALVNAVFNAASIAASATLPSKAR
jgi:CO/xanthine dehydrogenase Mo-binding subunit